MLVLKFYGYRVGRFCEAIGYLEGLREMDSVWYVFERDEIIGQEGRWLWG